MMSSVMPSLKYSWAGSPLILVKARTAIDGLSGSGRADALSALEVVTRETSAAVAPPLKTGTSIR
jgi:hypothetical protein